MAEHMGITIGNVDIQARKEVDIRPGDTVRVWQKIEEKGKTRLQAFEGVVLARKHGTEAGATFTVRRMAGEVAVEKIFPLYSPNIDKIEVVRRAKVRRAKLYHIREKAAREIRRQMRKMKLVSISTENKETSSPEAVEVPQEASLEVGVDISAETASAETASVEQGAEK